MISVDNAFPQFRIRTDLKIGHAIGLVVFLLLQSLALLFPSLPFQGFSQPAGLAAAAFYGTPTTVEFDLIHLSLPGINVSVTDACSGFSFFSLLSGLLIGMMVTRSPRRQWITSALALLALSYAITFLSNVSRIICAVEVRLFTTGFIPPVYNDAIHQAVGTVIFVFALTFTWTTLTKYYDRPRTH